MIRKLKALFVSAEVRLFPKNGELAMENNGCTFRLKNQISKGVTVCLHLPLQIRPDYYK